MEEKPVSEDEVEVQLAYIQRALDAEPEERRAVLVDALLAYGHRVGYAIHWLAAKAVEEGSQDTRWEQLATEFNDLLTRWLDGEQLTARADENQRRAAAAVAMAEQQPGLGSLAASIVLGLPRGDPQRDVALARRLLEAYQAAQGGDGAEAELSVLTRLVDLDDPQEDELGERVERGLALEPGIEDSVPRRSFRVAAAGRYMELAIHARDGDDADGQHRLAQRGLDLLDDFPPDAGTVSLQAALFSVLDDDQRAAEAFHRAVEDESARDETRLMAAQFEARMRFNSDESDRVVELLEPRLAQYERQYLTAVADEDVASEGGTFGDVTLNLAFAYAKLGRWAQAVSVLDRGKSRRARYRAALRSTAEGAEILARERDLYALARGATQRPPAVPDANVDPLAAGVSPHAALLEAYRTLRPQLETDALATPSLADIAAVLRADEAALLIGQRSDATLVAAVRPGDTATPRIGRLVPFPADRWVDVLAPSEGYGWVTALAASAGRIETAAALWRLLEVADELVGDVVRELYADGVRRLVVVPHRYLHLVPFWALPSTSQVQVETAPSAAALVSARGEPAPRLGAGALVVDNPTGDLRVAAAEADAVERRLAALGVQSRRRSRAEATESEVLTALGERPSVLHFCGHGRSDMLQPERSALLLHPEPGLVPGSDDPFVAWTAAVEEWHEEEDVRSGDVPGLGRVSETLLEGGGVERRLEYGERGTLWSRYDGERRVAAAELWSAGDMLVGGELDGCALVVLSACESGAGSLGTSKLDEATGLPAAMQLGGASSIVATMWPVGDGEGAVFVDELYRELGERSGTVDLAEVLHTVRERLRAMPRDAALERVATLRAETSDPVARFALERFARDIRAGDELPFGDPYDWAPYFVLGRSEITIEEQVS